MGRAVFNLPARLFLPAPHLVHATRVPAMTQNSSAHQDTVIPRQDSMAPEALQRDLLKLLFENLHRSMLAVVIVATGLVAGLWSHAEKGMLLTWWCVVALIAFVRLRLAYRWQRQPDYRPLHLWQRSFRWGAIAMTLVWSTTVPLFMWNVPLTQQIFIAFVLAGITAGAVPTLAADLRMVLFYPYALMLPVAFVLLIRTVDVGPAMGVLILVYLVMITSTALDYHRALHGSIADRHALAEKERETRMLFEHVPTGVFYYDRDLRLRDCNTAFAKSVEAEKKQLIGLDMRKLRDQRILPTLETPIRDAKPAHYQGYYITNFSGIEKWGDIHVAPLFDGSGRVKGAIGAIQDRTRERSALEKLEHLALYDSLTGLPNRKLFQERLQQCLGEVERNGLLSALLYLDLDDFKRINDSLGHEAGD
ncbi:diguanylate cyclase, partial [Candidatus Parcubacteria bacterium]